MKFTFCILLREIYATKTTFDETNYFRQAPCQFFCSLEVCFEDCLGANSMSYGIRNLYARPWVASPGDKIDGTMISAYKIWRRHVPTKESATHPLIRIARSQAFTIGKPHGLLRQCIVPRPHEQNLQTRFLIVNIFGTRCQSKILLEGMLGHSSFAKKNASFVGIFFCAFLGQVHNALFREGARTIGLVCNMENYTRTPSPVTSFVPMACALGVLTSGSLGCRFRPRGYLCI